MTRVKQIKSFLALGKREQNKIGEVVGHSLYNRKVLLVRWGKSKEIEHIHMSWLTPLLFEA